MILELLLLAGLAGTAGAVTSAGKDDEDDEKSDNDNLKDIMRRAELDVKLLQYNTNFNNSFIKPTFPNSTYLTKSSYWENPYTGDYIRHSIDIEITD